MKRILMAEFCEYNSPYKLGAHQYAKRFAQSGYEVLWLSPVYNQLYLLKDKELYKQKKKMHNSSLVELDHNIFGYAPYSPVLYGKMPVLDTKLAGKLSVRWTLPNLYNVLKNNGFCNIDILWLSNPKYYYLTKLLKYKKIMYRCADDYSEFANTFKSFIKFEEEIIKSADKVFVTSYELLERKKSLRNELVYLPNGVDLNNFIRDHYSIPDEFLNDCNKKCIYVGAIESWFDIQLMRLCAERLPHISFYIIGPIKIDISEVKDIKNIFMLGKRDYKDIPDYLYFSDVAVIPFKVNKLTDSVSPIKLYEYMSTGLNVVSTDMRELKYINSPAYIAKNDDEFCMYIEEGIGNKERDRKRNIEFAKENTWERGFGIIRSFIV